MKKLSLSKLLMLVTLLLLAAFEGYWLQKLYADEYRNLKKEVTFIFGMQFIPSNAFVSKGIQPYFREKPELSEPIPTTGLTRKTQLRKQDSLFLKATRISCQLKTLTLKKFWL